MRLFLSVKLQDWFKYHATILQTRSLRERELFTYNLQQWHWAKCLPHFVFYIIMFVLLSLCRTQRMSKIRTPFCLVVTNKRSLLTSCAFWFAFLNASSHFCFRFFLYYKQTSDGYIIASSSTRLSCFNWLKCCCFYLFRCKTDSNITLQCILCLLFSVPMSHKW